MSNVNWFEVWITKSLVEMIIPLVFVSVFAFVYLIGSIPRAIKQTRCKHQTIRETRACDAICLKCGRNLGFIQKWRDQNKGKDGFKEV